VDNIPAELRASWVAADGTARIQVCPRNISNDPAALAAFSDRVLSVAPKATGAPISLREFGKTIIGALRKPGCSPSSSSSSCSPRYSEAYTTC
jgi:hypothetical protein